MKVYIIGAGPGDPKLLTIRAAELIGSCPAILYTGSLVSKEILGYAKPDARILDSSSMTLEEIEQFFLHHRDRNEDVARVHTGDPTIFGSTAEQIRKLEAHGIAWEMVPGVSSFTAAASVLGKELTLPELSQTVILTRCEGRTPVPEGERLADLARHKATLCLFLSITLIKQMAQDLIPSYGEHCPVAVVQKASWPDQVVVRGTLGTIAGKVKERGIKSQAMIIVGEVLESKDFANSKLYDSEFSHKFRKKRKTGTEKTAIG